MAKLETHYPLSDVDASAIIGLNHHEDVVVMTTSARIFVIDISSRRVTRSFPMEEESFTSPAIMLTSPDGGNKIIITERFGSVIYLTPHFHLRQLNCA